MRLEIKKDGKIVKAWVAKTSRGFNKRQRAEIAVLRLQLERR